MHVLSRQGSVFTLSGNEWREREYIALYDKQRQRIHGLRNVVHFQNATAVPLQRRI